MEINIRPIASKELYEVSEVVEIKGIKIPTGFRFDGASIPSAFWQIISTPFHPKVIGPAMIHDWLYYTHVYSRKETDELFVDLCKKNGLNSVRCAAIYRAVRMFGGGYWKNTTEDVKFLLTLREQQIHPQHFYWPEEVLEYI